MYKSTECTKYVIISTDIPSYYVLCARIWPYIPPMNTFLHVYYVLVKCTWCHVYLHNVPLMNIFLHVYYVFVKCTWCLVYLHNVPPMNIFLHVYYVCKMYLMPCVFAQCTSYEHFSTFLHIHYVFVHQSILSIYSMCKNMQHMYLLQTSASILLNMYIYVPSSILRWWQCKLQ